MDIQKIQSDNYMGDKKYKLSFFGNSARTDWSIVVILGFALLVVFSVLFSIQSSVIKNSIAENLPTSASKEYFDIEKAKTLLQDFQGEVPVIDQPL